MKRNTLLFFIAFLCIIFIMHFFAIKVGEEKVENIAMRPTTFPTIEQKAKYIDRESRPPIIMYHLIDSARATNKYLYVSPKKLEKDLAYLKKKGYKSLFPEDVFDLEGAKKPVLITFDDGYENNFTNAYPLLKKYKMKATIFVVSDRIGTENYLNEEQIREMSESGLVRIYSHTRTHADLTELSLDEVEKEFAESNKAIYDITGVEVVAVSYPGGHANGEIFEVAERYYNIGFMVGGPNASFSRAINLQRQTATEKIEIKKILKD